jgi:hypothetical protein
VLAYVKGARRGTRDSGAPGVAHEECEPGPGATAPSGRLVLWLKTAKRPRAPAAPLLGGRPGQACTPRGLRGLSTGLAHHSASPRQRPSSCTEVGGDGSWTPGAYGLKGSLYQRCCFSGGGCGAWQLIRPVCSACELN